jgi:hypothetical protein
VERQRFYICGNCPMRSNNDKTKGRKLAIDYDSLRIPVAADQSEVNLLHKGRSINDIIRY